MGPQLVQPLFDLAQSIQPFLHPATGMSSVVHPPRAKSSAFSSSGPPTSRSKIYGGVSRPLLVPHASRGVSVSFFLHYPTNRIAATFCITVVLLPPFKRQDCRAPLPFPCVKREAFRSEP